MSERQITGSNYSLSYWDFNDGAANIIATEKYDIITMRLQQVKEPEGYQDFGSTKSIICDVKIEGR